METRAGADASEEIRCPSCSRLMVLRSGPRITPHFAHRPRQACRRRPGRAAVTPLRLEQLTLFDVEPLTAPPPLPVFYYRPRPGPVGEARRAAPTPPPRRRRRAWLPRLIRWIRARVGPAKSRAGVPRPSPLKLEETPARGSDGGQAGQ